MPGSRHPRKWRNFAPGSAKELCGPVDNFPQGSFCFSSALSIPQSAGPPPPIGGGRSSSGTAMASSLMLPRSRCCRCVVARPGRPRSAHRLMVHHLGTAAGQYGEARAPTAPRASGEALAGATVLPVSGPSPAGGASRSKAFLRTPGIWPLYGCVPTKCACAPRTSSFAVCNRVGSTCLFDVPVVQWESPHRQGVDFVLVPVRPRGQQPAHGGKNGGVERVPTDVSGGRGQSLSRWLALHRCHGFRGSRSWLA